MKNNSYIKILKVSPINFNLKSELEKNAILNSYKIFLKTCEFDIQILIQSNKEDLSKNILKIEEQIEKEKNKNINKIYMKYIKYLKNINNEKISSSKNFYLIIKENIKETNFDEKNHKEIIKNNLKEKFFKIKECLSRCGNNVIEINNEEEIKKIIFSFLNIRKYFNEF